MPRIRTVKPDLFDDPDVGVLPATARWLFVGLLTQADREGRLKDDPRLLKVRLCPFDDTADVDALLNVLADANLIIRYTVAGHAYLQIRTFEKHQRPHPKELKSQIPPIPAPNRRRKTRPAVKSRDRDIPGREQIAPDREKKRPAVKSRSEPGGDLDLGSLDSGSGKGRSTDQDLRGKPRGSRAPVENPAEHGPVITALVTALFAEPPPAPAKTWRNVDLGEIGEQVKLRCARARIAYDGRVVAKAVDSALAKLRLPKGWSSAGELADRHKRGA